MAENRNFRAVDPVIYPQHRKNDTGLPGINELAGEISYALPATVTTGKFPQLNNLLLRPKGIKEPDRELRTENLEL